MANEPTKTRTSGALKDAKLESFLKNSEALTSHLSSLDTDAFLSELLDVDALHFRLFKDTSNEEWAVGKRRTKPMVVVHFTEGRVLSRTPMCPAEEIDGQLVIYRELLSKLAIDHPAAEEAVDFFAGAIHAFFTAHPFPDGNGRLLRFSIKAFCNYFGYSLNEKWTVADRCYGRHFSYAVRHFPKNPYLLSGAMREYIEPVSLTPGVYRSTESDCMRDAMNLGVSGANLPQFLRDCMGIGGGGDGGGGGGNEEEGEEFLEYLCSKLGSLCE